MEALDRFIEEHSKEREKHVEFVDYLYELMNKYKIDKASELYTKANISRQLWSSIISKKSNPSLNVCIKLAFVLGLNNHECKYLLKKAGYTLPSSNKYCLIIRFALENKYSINELNDLLIEYGYSESLIF